MLITGSADTLPAFQAAAGTSAAHLSFSIRSILMMLMFIWAAWCIKGLIHRIQESGIQGAGVDESWFILRILVLVALIIVVVFI
jgi:integrating conjugative element protein (TIGR03758 family)